MNPQTTYKNAGVDLDFAEQSIKSVAAIARTTFTPNVLSEIGLFGGCFRFDPSNYDNPVLVSSIDGVGTKLKVALAMAKHDTVGEDLVNHCVNDIMTMGADPLFFLDYIGTQKLYPNMLCEIVEGMARGCRNAKCVLLGGETAEMPGFYSKGEYDLAGTIVGVVERDKLIDGSRISEGDVLVGLPSNGLHTNGYSLARKIMFKDAKLALDQFDEQIGNTIGEELLRVHKSYRQAIINAREFPHLVGISHITGGGIEGNTRRLIKEELGLQINWESWQVPTIFRLVQKLGNVPDEEMRRVFNMGIGLVFIVQANAITEFQNMMAKIGEPSVVIGKVVLKN